MIAPGHSKSFIILKRHWNTSLQKTGRYADLYTEAILLVKQQQWYNNVLLEMQPFDNFDLK